MNTLSIPGHYRANTMKLQSWTTSAQITQLAATDAVKGRPINIFVQASPSNSGTITIANTNPAVSGTGIVLAAGANCNLPSNNPAEWYVVSSSGTNALVIVYSGQEN